MSFDMFKNVINKMFRKHVFNLRIKIFAIK